MMRHWSFAEEESILTWSDSSSAWEDSLIAIGEGMRLAQALRAILSLFNLDSQMKEGDPERMAFQVSETI